MTLVLLVLACTGKNAADDSGPAAPSLIEEQPVCASPDVTMVPFDPGDGSTAYTATTEHYALTIEGFDEDETLNLASLAETSWGALSNFFGSDVPGPLQVEIAADDAGFQAMLAADGITGVDGAGGYYDPGTGKAYLFRQPTAYYSRVLMIHEMVHQYQDKADGIGGLPFWYVEGLAEALSRHHWDGSCVQLRVRPLLSWEDMAAQAQAELDADGQAGPDLVTVLGGSTPSRALSQELVRVLTSEPDLAPGFATWRVDVRDGNVSAVDPDAFAADVVSVDDLTTALLAFVPSDQEPMSPVYLDWIPEGADRALGFASASSAARVKGAVTSFASTVAWPSTGDVGSVYGYDDSTGDVEFAFLAADGTVSRFAVIGGAVTWDNYGSVAHSDTVKWSQAAADGTTTVSIGGGSVDLPRSLPAAGGLALYGATADFSAITWGS